MEITCSNIAKVFRKEVLFKELDYQFVQGGHYAILGPNSSGKSTLLKVIAGVLSPTKGTVDWSDKNKPVGVEQRYSYYSFASPEMSFVNEFTVEDIFHFHFSLKRPKLSVKEILDVSDLNSFSSKAFEDLSSGLKAKTKLAIALFTHCPVLLLDEPCTNFDQINTRWYQSMLEKYCMDQLVIIASNDVNEYTICKEFIDLQQFKS